MTCTITQNKVGWSPMSLYHYLRREGYSHRSAVTSVLMYFSPSKEDLCKRLKRRREHYHDAEVYCTCCGRGNVTVLACPGCGKFLCQDCTPNLGAHVCEPV